MAGLVRRGRPVFAELFDDIEATYTDGILEIRIGMRAARPEPKQIPVKAV